MPPGLPTTTYATEPQRVERQADARYRRRHHRQHRLRRRPPSPQVRRPGPARRLPTRPRPHRRRRRTVPRWHRRRGLRRHRCRRHRPAHRDDLRAVGAPRRRPPRHRLAPVDALAGPLLDARREGIGVAFQTSTVSLAAVASVVARLAPPTGASVVGLDFDAIAAWPVYNWMASARSVGIAQPPPRTRPRAGRHPRQPRRRRADPRPRSGLHPRVRGAARFLGGRSAHPRGTRPTRRRSPTPPASFCRTWPGPSPARSCTSRAATMPPLHPLRRRHPTSRSASSDATRLWT